jgi:flavin-dependent dehydrogenase
VRRTTLRYGNDTIVISVKPSHGVDALYAPRASVLDPLLVGAAAAAGADMRLDLCATGVVAQNERVAGVQVASSAGDPVELRAPLLIGADGIESVVARGVAASYSRVGEHTGAMSCGYWPELDTDGFEWIFLPNACSGVVPTNHGDALVFASASPERIGNGGTDVICNIVAEAFPALADRLRDGPVPHDLQTWRGHHGYIRRSQGPGWALVGDAGYFQDPISVHGLTDALRDAELLARAVIDGLGGEVSIDRALEEYEFMRDRLSIPSFEVNDRIASHQWDAAEMASLQLQLSSAMANEVEALAALEPGPVA